jgi:hypothetical protein
MEEGSASGLNCLTGIAGKLQGRKFSPLAETISGYRAMVLSTLVVNG